MGKFDRDSGKIRERFMNELRIKSPICVCLHLRTYAYYQKLALIPAIKTILNSSNRYFGIGAFVDAEKFAQAAGHIQDFTALHGVPINEAAPHVHDAMFFFGFA